MSQSDRHSHRQDADISVGGDGVVESRGVFGILCLLLFLVTFFVAGPWAGFHAVLLGCFGVIILLFPPQIRLPGAWWGLSIAFVVCGAAAFLPVSWFHMPEWRSKLESLGLDTGPLVVIQSRMAAESLALFAITIFVGFWMAGHRPTPAQIRLWALVFTLGVACYAVIAKVAQNSQLGLETTEGQIYGFFPNRNHSATYLAMGVICGLGCTLQAMRDKRFVILTLALAATAVCLWAIATWSISRAGIVLVSIGGLLWVIMLGRRYLGRHGLWAIALIAFISAGLFLIVNTEVKGRITDTVVKADTLVGAESNEESETMKFSSASIQQLDLRIPIFLDTFDLIREYPWTGIGAGQYPFIIPQYRKRTLISNDFVLHHPESDWLWMASELGIPATLFLLALVAFALRKSLKDILTGRDRALRAGCLVAAMLVPIHGIFDVPGHRITLALSAVFLFVLSLHPPTEPVAPAVSRVWLSRLFAACLLAISFFLIHAQWGEGGQPAHTEAQSLILDCKLHRSEGSLALKFEDTYPLAERAYALELALAPALIDVPLRQAAAWIELDPQKTKDLWQEAIRRADRVDALKPGTTSARDNTLQQIRQQAKGKPLLESWGPAFSSVNSESK